jgi:ketosteroid isomerase-like protein
LGFRTYFSILSAIQINLKPMKKFILFFIPVFLLFACNHASTKKDNTETPTNNVVNKSNASKDAGTLKEELMTVEAGFVKMINEKGFKEGLMVYGTPDAILMRDGSPAIHGLDSIKIAFKKDPGKLQLDMQTELADISYGGDMGYTFGIWKLNTKDDMGLPKVVDGSYVTIWRLQADNSWKYVLTNWITNKHKSGPGEKDQGKKENNFSGKPY